MTGLIIATALGFVALFGGMALLSRADHHCSSDQSRANRLGYRGLALALVGLVVLVAVAVRVLAR